MVWQKLTGHVNGHRVRVESRSGDSFVARTETDRLNKDIYTQLVNDAHASVEFWAWVESDAGGPVVKDFTRGDRPDNPPWEHP